MQGAIEAFIVRSANKDRLGTVVKLNFHIAMKGQFQFAFRSIDADFPIGDLGFDSGWKRDWLFSDSRHDFRPFSTKTFLYQTVHSNSPPSRCDRAWRSLITPRLVLRTAMPRPSRTG